MSDFLLILDADEWVTGETDWDKFYANLKERYERHHSPKIWGITYESVNENKFREKIIKRGSYPKLWQRPYLIQYMKTHNFFKFISDDSIWKSATTFPCVPDIFLRGNDKLRTPEYLKKSYEYQLKLAKYEKRYKEEYRKIAKNVSEQSKDARLPGIPLS